MSRPTQGLILRGATGGILAGLVVALWFLVADGLAGQPFRTPTLLWNVFQREAGPVTFRAVAAYSVLHFGVFALLGIAMAWLSAALPAPPRLLLGVVFGLVLQEVVFYSGLTLSGAHGLGVVPWAHVFGANILSGIVLMAFLHRAEHDERPFGLAALRSHPTLTRGIVTGLWGAAAVAVWFLLLDVLLRRPLYTPAALGGAFLLGSSQGGEVSVNLGVIAAYTVAHTGAFIVAGIILVAVAEVVERTPQFLLLATMFCILLEALVVAALALGAEWVLGTLGLWSVVVGNVLAVCAMGWYIWRTHPVLRRRLLQESVEVHV
jgi:hypothetical protein